MLIENLSARMMPSAGPILGKAVPGGLEIKNVLCPVDFSEFSFKAFSYASCLARHFHSRLFVQHTVPVPAGAPQALRTSLNYAGTEMRRLTAVARLELPEVHMLVDEGEIREKLLENIAKHEIDLVVMGSHGRRGFNRLGMGSVTERIVHEALCPVLAVCRPVREFVEPEELEPCHLTTVLCPTDFSPDSAGTFAHALHWAQEWSARLLLFHVDQEASPRTPDSAELLGKYMPSFEQQLGAAWETVEQPAPPAANGRFEISYAVRRGCAKDEILRFAEEQDADMIVMGSRGLGMSGATCGSTISGVVRDGRFPVLAAPHLPDQ